MNAVVTQPAELLSGGDGASAGDAADDDLAFAVDSDLPFRDGGRVNEQCPRDAALMAGDLGADVDEQRAAP